MVYHPGLSIFTQRTLSRTLVQSGHAYGPEPYRALSQSPEHAWPHGPEPQRKLQKQRGTNGLEDMPERMPDRMSKYMSDRMPNRMLECMPERMPEYMSDRMSFGGGHSKKVFFKVLL